MITVSEDIRESQDKVLMLWILAMITSIEHDHILITIHDSGVVQIDKTEKIMRKTRECVCK